MTYLQIKQKRRQIVMAKELDSLPEKERKNVNNLLYFEKIGKYFPTSLEKLPAIMQAHKTKKFRIENGVIWRSR